MNAISGAMLALFLFLTSTTVAASAETLEHTHEVRQWQGERLAALLHAESYLTIVGLHWLNLGTARFGSASDSDIRFPENLPSHLGTFEYDGEAVLMRLADPRAVTIGDLPASDEVPMADDVSGNQIVARYANLSWAVIQRNGRHAVRIRDLAHPILADFGPLPYFEIDRHYRVEARLLRYPSPRIVQVGTVIEGLGWEPESPGVVEFALDGETYQLEAYTSGPDRLFFVFGDRTSGRETYPAGRFLYADVPGDNGITVLDFNKAYSPPCAFNDFSTCPVATPANRLPVRIPAGERHAKSIDPALTAE